MSFNFEILNMGSGGYAFRERKFTIDDLEDGFEVVYRNGAVRYVLCKTKTLHDENGTRRCYLKDFDEDMNFHANQQSGKDFDIMKVYNRQKTLVFEREEKSETQIQIEKLQETINVAQKEIEELKKLVDKDI